MKRTLKVVALASTLIITSGNARAEEVLLSCWGTVELMQQGKQVNVPDERSSLAVAVDVAKKIITINKISWPIAGDASRETIASMDPDKGSLTLNRITGAISVHFIEYKDLKNSMASANWHRRCFDDGRRTSSCALNGGSMIRPTLLPRHEGAPPRGLQR